MKILNRSTLKRAFTTVGAIGLLALAAGAGCSATDGTGTPKSCTGLDVNVSAQATVKAYGQAASALKDAALGVEAQWLTTCNAINADLGEDTSKTSAGEACGVLNARIKQANATVSIVVKSECHADVNVQGDCQAKCNLPNCDIQAKCEPGKLSVACNGACEGTCDVQAPSATCTGTCSGKCTADVAVACTGSCTGECSGAWKGTCDAGCEAQFEGTCGGTCMGTCQAEGGTATESKGECKGTCVGTCSAKASGSCSAKCNAQFSGTCNAECKGSCEVGGGAQCSGKCEGTCTYAPGKADCNGECHGKCSAAVAPPSCEGTLNCEGAAECQASCEGSATATASCESSATLDVSKNDAQLYTALKAHLDDIKSAWALTIALKDPIATLVTETGAAVSALGNIGASGAACAASSLAIAGQASASISVSVTAQASVQGQTS